MNYISYYLGPTRRYYRLDTAVTPMAVEILEKIVLAGNSNSFLSCKNKPLINIALGFFIEISINIAF